MGRKIVELFGYVRTFVYVLVLAIFAGALSVVGIPPLGIAVATATFAVVLWKAPFGARYRKNF